MEIPLEYKIMILKKMLEIHDNLVIHKRITHPGLCHLYTRSVLFLFGSNGHLRDIYIELISLPFEDLDECTMKKKAIQDFEAVKNGIYWWGMNQFSPRKDFLLNAIQTLEYKLEHNT